MSALAEARRLIPQGFDVASADCEQSAEPVLLVFHGGMLVSVMNGTEDIAEQVRLDTCKRHRAYVCPACMPSAYDASEPLDPREWREP